MKVECFLLIYLLTATAALAAPVAGGGGGGSRGPRSDAGGNSVDSTDALTSFTISNPYCYQPDPQLDQCAINFRYIQAIDNQTSAPYMTWLAVTISGKKRFECYGVLRGHDHLLLRHDAGRAESGLRSTQFRRCRHGVRQRL